MAGALAAVQQSQDRQPVAASQEKPADSLAPSTLVTEEPLPPAAPIDEAGIAAEIATEETASAEPEPEAPPEEAPPPEPTATPVVVVSAPPPTATPRPAPPPPTATPRPPTPVPPPPTATPVPPPPAAPVGLSAMEQELYNLHNSHRAQNGLPSFRLETTLVHIARTRAQDMAAKNYFSHTSPSGETAFTLMGQWSFSYTAAGENIARNDYPNQQTVTIAMNGFMNSPGHRANILERDFNTVGIGVAVGANGMKYFAVVFAGH